MNIKELNDKDKTKNLDIQNRNFKKNCLYALSIWQQ